MKVENHKFKSEQLKYVLKYGYSGDLISEPVKLFDSEKIIIRSKN